MNVATRAAVALLSISVAAFGAQRNRPAPVIGSWQAADKSNTLSFRSDGTGSNANGSRFHWRLEKNRVVFRAVAANGAIGKEGAAPIEFTRDRREFALVYEGGNLRSVFYLLTSQGVRYAHRSALDRQYPKPAAPRDDSSADDGPAPTRHEGKKPPYAVGSNVQVSSEMANVLHSEVVIAADPARGNRLVAGAMPSSPKFSRVAIYASEDSGKTWKLSFERKGNDPECFADPAFAVGSDGTIYFVNMYFKNFQSVGGESLQFLRRSADSLTWVPGSSVNSWHDRPFLAIDNTVGLFHGRLYCMTHNGFFTSRDNGDSFSASAPFSPKVGSYYTTPGNPVVLSDGTVVTVQEMFTDKDGKSAASGKKWRALLARRFDDDDERIEREHEAGGGDIINPGDKKTGRAAHDTGLLSARSSVDGGQTLSKEHAIASYDFNHLSYSNVPVLAADASAGPYRDRLYVVWNDALPTDGTGIFFARSEDKGATWSRPMLLSEQSPEPIRDAQKWRSMAKYTGYLPCIAVNTAGVVGVSWYDNRDLPLGAAGWNYRFRASLDGGKTWESSIRVSDKTTLFPMKSKSATHLEDRRARYHAGHTSGLCSDANGAFHALWIDGRTGVRQVWTATIALQRS